MHGSSPCSRTISETRVLTHGEFALLTFCSKLRPPKNTTVAGLLILFENRPNMCIELRHNFESVASVKFCLRYINYTTFVSWRSVGDVQ